MELEELKNYQETFDSKHEGYFRWNSKVTDENVELLEFLLLSLAGEVGEAANIAKKIIRGDFSLTDKKGDLEEEIADIFIYLLKLSYQLDISLEDAYMKKMKKNWERFEKYENKTEVGAGCQREVHSI